MRVESSDKTQVMSRNDFFNYACVERETRDARRQRYVTPIQKNTVRSLVFCTVFSVEYSLKGSHLVGYSSPW